MSNSDEISTFAGSISEYAGEMKEKAYYEKRPLNPSFISQGAQGHFIFPKIWLCPGGNCNSCTGCKGEGHEYDDIDKDFEEL
jgi:hypothetical protein